MLDFWTNKSLKCYFETNVELKRSLVSSKNSRFALVAIWVIWVLSLLLAYVITNAVFGFISLNMM